MGEKGSDGSSWRGKMYVNQSRAERKDTLDVLLFRIPWHRPRMAASGLVVGLWQTRVQPAS